MKRPRSPTSSLHGIPLCQNVGAAHPVVPCLCSSPNLCPNQYPPNVKITKETKLASLKRNRFSISGARTGLHGIHSILAHRERDFSGKMADIYSSNMNRWAEFLCINNGKRSTLKTRGTTKSTISIAFSCDGSLFASTHGDHSIKVFRSDTMKLVSCLEGHPRTPWTVKFHPRIPSRLASGCLGFEVRVWDAYAGRCLFSARLQKEIVSLAFHPVEDWLGLASGRKLYLWEYESPSSFPVEILRWNRNVRCVGFSPCGTRLITGEASPNDSTSSTHYINNRQEVTVRLLMWDLDVPKLEASIQSHEDITDSSDVVSNPNVIISHAVLYNDGGFDVSPCGRYLCAISYNADATVSSSGEEFQENRATNIDTSRPSTTPSNELTPRMTAISRRVLSLGLRSPPHGLEEEHAETEETGPQHSLLVETLQSSTSGARNTATDATPSQESPPKMRRIGGGQQGAFKTPEQSPLVNKTLNSNVRTPEPAPRPNDTHSTAASRPERRAISGAIITNTPETNQPSTVNLRRLMRMRRRRAQAVATTSTGVGAYSLLVVNLEKQHVGSVENECILKGPLARGITSVKFSPTCEKVLVGYGMRQRHPTENEHQRIAAVFHLLPTGGICKLKVFLSEQDDVNIACFHPVPGYGFLCGTREGKVRCIGFGRAAENTSSSSTTTATT
eukprot:CAMPEP_0203754786 /NCGR_PEP_ID=MMETSP0098-20131031/8349_1 /ASSEMBLY_ACC=CAM_ASM_000208 /TAXON_ID=96639 /ORGANISM=" , Strain NY0313808BC1" /LENGTH=673 /DNA_ID=CAMNT_0050645979 /DNA_START=365 /DNA_END=2382 /DNA_ORIENTATION=-